MLVHCLSGDKSSLADAHRASYQPWIGKPLEHNVDEFELKVTDISPEMDLCGFRVEINGNEESRSIFTGKSKLSAFWSIAFSRSSLREGMALLRVRPRLELCLELTISIFRNRLVSYYHQIWPWQILFKPRSLCLTLNL